jgi:hypothetical protein
MAVVPLSPVGRLPRPADRLPFDVGGVLYDDTRWRRRLTAGNEDPRP